MVTGYNPEQKTVLVFRGHVCLSIPMLIWMLPLLVCARLPFLLFKTER